jgi:hypothetical protein
MVNLCRWEMHQASAVLAPERVGGSDKSRCIQNQHRFEIIWQRLTIVEDRGSPALPHSSRRIDDALGRSTVSRLLGPDGMVSSLAGRRRRHHAAGCTPCLADGGSARRPRTYSHAGDADRKACAGYGADEAQSHAECPSGLDRRARSGRRSARVERSCGGGKPAPSFCRLPAILCQFTA